MPERPTRHQLAALLWMNIAIGAVVLASLLVYGGQPASSVFGAVQSVALVGSAFGIAGYAIWQAGQYAKHDGEGVAADG